MDPAVAMVRAFLKANGYFTMVEVPVLAINDDGTLRTATDLDILAVRFPGERRFVAGSNNGHGDRAMRSASADLDHQPDQTELIIGEIKQGRAELNSAATDPDVLRVALSRFGAFDDDEIPSIIDDLQHEGSATRQTACQGKMRVRLFAFGSTYPDRPPGRRYSILLHRRILAFFSDMMRQHRDVVPHLHSKDPFLGQLLLMSKARSEGKGERRGGRRAGRRR